MGEVTADLLKKIGMTVDFVATDWGTVGQRRASKNPPGQGGWGMFHTWHAGADCANPGELHRRARQRREGLVRLARRRRASRRRSPPGSTPSTLDEEKAVIGRAQQGGAWSTSIYIPTGFYYGYQAWRTQCRAASCNGPLPFFWGVKKA